ncbi:MAG: diguanylate cyclase, partial [Helicobacteraceae bacterium]|nr:diguanylate cyclase [Candidatus Sulfurimonas ponti]
MKKDDDILEITSFVLSSSTEVPETLEKIEALNKKNLLIHIVSFLHNTVLVQNLKKSLLKSVPQAQIVLLNHEDKSKTILTIFSLDKETNDSDIAHEVLSALHLENKSKKISLEEYRIKLFNRYFTDHLTNLPNIFQLRKDLQENEDFGLILINIDNFHTINNFYGFLVGDYVLEEVGRILKNFLPSHEIYRTSGNEFAFVLDKNLGFYDLKKYLIELYNSINHILVQYQDIKIYIDITLASSANRDSNQVFSKVSMALKHAKNMRLPFWIYEDRMKFENDYERNLELSGTVRSAVEDSRIIPYYQAIIDNESSKTKKYECLARLIDKNQKILSPVLFIPVAKKIKVYSQVTKLIIEKSFSTFENNNLEFSINLSIE